MRCHNVESKNLTAWYELRMDGANFVVDVHQKAWKFFGNFIKECPFDVVEYPGILKIPEFAPIKEKPGNWGFGGESEWKHSTRDGWISALFPVPGFPREGESSLLAGEKLYASMATLEILLNALAYFEEEISDYYAPQMLVVHNVSVEKEWGKSKLAVIVSSNLSKFLASEMSRTGQTNRYEPVMNANKAMMQQIEGKNLSANDFRCDLQRPKWISFTVSRGNSCGLDPENRYNQDINSGYELLDHNLDDLWQQIYLLAGLFALYDHARKWSWLDRKEEQIKRALKTGLDLIYQPGNDFTCLFSRSPSRKAICGVDGRVTLEEIKKRYEK